MRRFILFLIGIFVALVFQRLITGRRQETVKNPAAPVTSREPDPLTEINGIGPAFEQALNALGIRTFADLARQNADDLARRLSARVRVTAERIRRDGWIEQARARSQA